MPKTRNSISDPKDLQLWSDFERRAARLRGEVLEAIQPYANHQQVFSRICSELALFSGGNLEVERASPLFKFIYPLIRARCRNTPPGPYRAFEEQALATYLMIELGECQGRILAGKTVIRAHVGD